MITSLLPPSAPMTAAGLLAQMEDGHAPLGVGDSRVLSYFEEASGRLRSPSLSRRFPELGALGVFLRASHLSTVLARVHDAPGQWRFPRGLVLHIAPGNADTVFVYSWALSALAGNRNIVRVSGRSGEVTQALLEVLVAALAKADPVVARTQRVVAFEHDEEALAPLSATCDLRVLWGGDASIMRLREVPLRPAARDLTFPDRASFAAICAGAYLASDDAERGRIAQAFFNDGYLFGQAACASPRALFWVGGHDETAQAQALFWPLLAQTVERRGLRVDAAMAIEKRVATYGLAADGVVDAVRFFGNEIAVLSLSDPVRLPRRWLGTGTFAQLRLDTLAQLPPLVRRQDQTLACHGFAAIDLERLARELEHCGIDRIVPLGHALEFSPIWDGYDLMREFTRLLTIY